MSSQSRLRSNVNFSNGVLALLATVSLSACGASSEDTEGKAGMGAQREDLIWKCAETATTCSCHEVSEDSVLISFSAREVEGCWDRECCIFEAAKEDRPAACECVTSDSSCEELVASMRNAEIVSECAPGSKPDLDRYAKEGERCDASYLDENELWACHPDTYCGTNEDRLHTCVEGTTETRAIDEACRSAAASTETTSSTLQLSEPVVILVNDVEYRMTTVETGSLDEVDSDGCLASLEVTFSTDGDVGERTTLELQVTAVDEALVVSWVNLDSDGFTDPGEAEPPTVLEADPVNIPFTVSTFGQTCQAFGGRCLAGGVEWHLQGKVGEVEFAETTLRLEGTICSSLALTPKGVCPSAAK